METATTTTDAAVRRHAVMGVSISNFKKIRRLDLVLDGERVQVIAGSPGQGKTSVLEALQAALSSYVPPSKVHQGADAAEIVIDLGGLGKLCRRIPSDPNGELGKARVIGDTWLTGPDGKPVKDAPNFIKGLLGAGTWFDPLAFIQLGDGPLDGKTGRLRMQRDMLLQSLSVQLTKSELLSRIVQEGNAACEVMNVLEDTGVIDLDRTDWGQHPTVIFDSFLDAIRSQYTAANAEFKQAEHELKARPAPAGLVSDKPVAELRAAVDAVSKAYYQAQAGQTGYEASLKRRDELRSAVAESEKLPAKTMVTAQLEKCRKDRSDISDTIDRLERELRAAKENLDEIDKRINKGAMLLSTIDAHEARVRDLAALEAELSGVGPVDVSELKTALDAATEAVKVRELQDAHDAASARVVAATGRVEVLGGLVKLFRDTLPSELLAKASLGIDGLCIQNDTICIGDIPIHQLGTSEALSIGVSLAAAMNPQLPYILIDRGESLGNSGLAAVAEEVAKHPGLTLFVTMVDDDAEAGPGVTVMSDGAAKQ